MKFIQFPIFHLMSWLKRILSLAFPSNELFHFHYLFDGKLSNWNNWRNIDLSRNSGYKGSADPLFTTVKSKFQRIQSRFNFLDNRYRSTFKLSHPVNHDSREGNQYKKINSQPIKIVGFKCRIIKCFKNNFNYMFSHKKRLVFLINNFAWDDR